MVNQQCALQYAPLNLKLQSLGHSKTVWDTQYLASITEVTLSASNLRKTWGSWTTTWLMEPVTGTLRTATCEKEVGWLGKQHSKGRHTAASILQLTSDSTRLFLRKTVHKGVFKKAAIQNNSHDRQTRSVKHMIAYALNPGYLRGSPEVFTFPVSFVILTVRASYTVWD